MKIIVDKREKNSLVVSELVGQGIDVELKQLVVADYIVGNIAIERKTIGDLISSMINKRLVRQLEELKQYPSQILLVEGYEEQDLYSSGVNENAIRGLLLSVILDFNIPIIFTKNYEDSAKFLVVLAKKFEKKKTEISLKAKKKAFNLAEQQQFIIEGFPGIGPALAKALLKKFKTIKAIINADLAELCKVKKLGKKKAKILYDIIKTKYKI